MIVPPRFLVIWVATIIAMFYRLKRNLMKRIGLQNIQRSQKRFKQTSIEEDHTDSAKEKDEETTKLKYRFGIFGLGNPGSEYVNTRHNIGFNCIEDFAKRRNISLSLNKAKCLYGEYRVEEKLWIVGQPQTFMNLSGRSVRGLMDLYRIPVKNIAIIYDDISLPLGTLRIRFKGSSGGVEDVIRHLGGENQKFVRIRVGIGQPNKDVVSFVLQKWKPEEMKIIQKTIPRVSACVESLLSEGLSICMNKYNKSFEQFEEEEKSVNKKS